VRAVFVSGHGALTPHSGYLNASFFNRAELPEGDVFVTSSAGTLFSVSVIASKGTVSAAAARAAAAAHKQQQQQHATAADAEESSDEQRLPLWKVFSREPLAWRELRTLFVNGSIVGVKAWSAYPRFHPPEEFAPFTLAPGLCYGSALENAASAMEVAAVAGRNCALLVQQHLAAKRAAAARQAVQAPVSGSIAVS
jgi:prenylcysteine oxidase/farnesylcysteine lyase